MSNAFLNSLISLSVYVLLVFASDNFELSTSSHETIILSNEVPNMHLVNIDIIASPIALTISTSGPNNVPESSLISAPKLSSSAFVTSWSGSIVSSVVLAVVPDVVLCVTVVAEVTAYIILL